MSLSHRIDKDPFVGYLRRLLHVEPVRLKGTPTRRKGEVDQVMIMAPSLTIGLHATMIQCGSELEAWVGGKLGQTQGFVWGRRLKVWELNPRMLERVWANDGGCPTREVAGGASRDPRGS